VLVSFECRFLELDGVDLKDPGEDDVVEEEKGEDEEKHKQGDISRVQLVVGLGEGGREGRRERMENKLECTHPSLHIPSLPPSLPRHLPDKRPDHSPSRTGHKAR
jgi:hypothetical protein